jgi:hypothetical protein
MRRSLWGLLAGLVISLSAVSFISRPPLHWGGGAKSDRTLRHAVASANTIEAAAGPRWCGNNGLAPSPGVRDFDENVSLIEGLCLSRAPVPVCEQYAFLNGPNSTTAAIMHALRSSKCGAIPQELQSNLHVGPPGPIDVDAEDSPAASIAPLQANALRPAFMAPVLWTPPSDGPDAALRCVLGSTSSDALRLLTEALKQLAGPGEQMLRTVVAMLAKARATRIFASVGGGALTPEDALFQQSSLPFSLLLLASAAAANRYGDGDAFAYAVTISAFPDVSANLSDLFSACAGVHMLQAQPLRLVPERAWNADAVLISASSLPVSQNSLQSWLNELHHVVASNAIVLVTGCFFISGFPSATLQREGGLHAWADRHQDGCDNVAEAVESNVRWRVGHRHGGMLLLVNSSALRVPLQPAAQDKLIVTLAVNPARIANHYFQRVLRAVAGSQSLKPDRVVINVPDVFLRTGKRIIVPAWIYKVATITVHLCRTDHGPVTKLLPSVWIYAGHPETRLVVVDDDREHWPHLIEWLVRWEACLPGAVIANWIYQILESDGMRGMGILDNKVSFATSVLGNGGYMLHAGDVTAEQLITLPVGAEPCFTHDDLWISHTLSQNHVPMALVPGYPCSFWETHYGDDFENGVYADNGQADRKVKCINFLNGMGGRERAKAASLSLMQRWRIF